MSGIVSLTTVAQVRGYYRLPTPRGPSFSAQMPNRLGGFPLVSGWLASASPVRLYLHPGGMFHPTRNGCRGGRGSFEWEAIRHDKHRQNYLGNSIHAPHSRYERDLYWYSRDDKPASVRDERTRLLQEELRSQKERESKLMEFYLTHGLGAQLPPELLEERPDAGGGGVGGNNRRPQSPPAKVEERNSRRPHRTSDQLPPRDRAEAPRRSRSPVHDTTLDHRRDYHHSKSRRSRSPPREVDDERRRWRQRERERYSRHRDS